jgi:hypothetical protein
MTRMSVETRLKSMKEIYCRARRALVWIGEETEDAKGPSPYFYGVHLWQVNFSEELIFSW